MKDNLIPFPKMIFNTFEERINDVLENAEKIKEWPDEEITPGLIQLQLYNLAVAVEHLWIEIHDN
jgi:hypothetical protein